MAKNSDNHEPKVNTTSIFSTQTYEFNDNVP